MQDEVLRNNHLSASSASSPFSSPVFPSAPLISPSLASISLTSLHIDLRTSGLVTGGCVCRTARRAAESVWGAFICLPQDRQRASFQSNVTRFNQDRVSTPSQWWESVLFLCFVVNGAGQCISYFISCCQVYYKKELFKVEENSFLHLASAKAISTLLTLTLQSQSNNKLYFYQTGKNYYKLLQITHFFPPQTCQTKMKNTLFN